MDESDDVDEREGDADENKETAAEVGEEEQRDDDDRQEGQPDVAPQLVPDHLVRLPLGVFLKEGGTQLLNHHTKQGNSIRIGSWVIKARR